MTVTSDQVDAPKLASVQQALASVMAELPNIGKGDKSAEGYSYRGIEAVTKHVQPLFAKHGVVVAPSAEITDVRPSPAMKDGWTDVFIKVAWTITGPDGSTIAAQTTGIGRDRADKGANKAQTQAFKYLLLHLLCIADGKDDSDALSYEQDRRSGVPCPVCNERQEDKDSCREHLVAVHDFVRNPDGSVQKPKPPEASSEGAEVQQQGSSTASTSAEADEIGRAAISAKEGSEDQPSLLDRPTIGAVKGGAK